MLREEYYRLFSSWNLLSKLHQFGLACTMYANDSQDFLPPGANDIAHFPPTTWNAILRYGMSSDAAACQSIWHYPGVSKALFGMNIGQDTGNRWVYLGWELPILWYSMQVAFLLKIVTA